MKIRSSSGSSGFPSLGRPYSRSRAAQTLRTMRDRTRPGVCQIIPVCSGKARPRGTRSVVAVLRPTTIRDCAPPPTRSDGPPYVLQHWLNLPSDKNRRSGVGGSTTPGKALLVRVWLSGMDSDARRFHGKPAPLPAAREREPRPRKGSTGASSPTP
jgi:hypothetical protein